MLKNDGRQTCVALLLKKKSFDYDVKYRHMPEQIFRHISNVQVKQTRQGSCCVQREHMKNAVLFCFVLFFCLRVWYLCFLQYFITINVAFQHLGFAPKQLLNGNCWINYYCWEKRLWNLGDWCHSPAQLHKDVFTSFANKVSDWKSSLKDIH